MSELVIHANVDKPLLHVCQILKKTQRLGMSAAILFDDQNKMEQFDVFLWSFEQGSFIPHAIAGTKGAENGAFILATDSDDLPDAQNLFLLCKDVPSNITELLNRFPRALDVVGKADPELTEGRNRFRQYKRAGIVPNVVK